MSLSDFKKVESAKNERFIPGIGANTDFKITNEYLSRADIRSQVRALLVEKKLEPHLRVRGGVHKFDSPTQSVLL